MHKVRLLLIPLLILNIFQYLAADTLIITKYSDGGLIGDWVPVEVKTELPPGSKINWPIFADSTGSLELISESETDSTLKGDLMEYSRTFTLSAYDSIIVTIPEIILSYTRSGLEDPNFVKAPGFTLGFAAVSVDTTAPIKDIKEIEGYEYSWGWWWIVIWALAFVIIILAAYFINKHIRNKPVNMATMTKSLPPHVIALRRLEELEKKAYWKDNRYKLHHTEISDITRVYLESRFSVNATDLTTRELKQWFERSEIASKEWIQVIQWLETGDLIKFAKYTPVADENTEPIECIRNFVKNTSATRNENNNIKSEGNT